MTGENNAIKRLIAKCKDGGMKVVGYYSLIFNNVAIEMHPNWEMVTAKGETWRTMGRRYGLCCPNNLEYRAFLDENVKVGKNAKVGEEIIGYEDEAKTKIVIDTTRDMTDLLTEAKSTEGIKFYLTNIFPI